MKRLSAMTLAALLFATAAAQADPAPLFTCGDYSGDAVLDSSDVDAAVNYLFFEGPPPVNKSQADVNADLDVDLGDPVYLANHLRNGGPPPVCYIEEKRFHGSVLTAMGKIFADTTLLDSADVKFDSSATLLATAAIHLQDLQSQGFPVQPDAIDSVNAMVDDLTTIAAALRVGDYATVETSLRLFHPRFYNYAVDEGLYQFDSLLVAPFANAAERVLDMAELSKARAFPFEYIQHYLELDSAFVLPPAQLDSLAGELLAISDTTAQGILGLDDPEIRATLMTMSSIQGDPDVIEWFNGLASNPDSLHALMVSDAFDNAILSLGKDLCNGGTEQSCMDSVTFVGIWNDECEVVCTNRNCKLSKIEVVGWRTTCKIGTGKDLTLALLKAVPTGGRAPLKGTVIKALKGLQKVILEKDALGVRVCIKIEWEHCENTWCLFGAVKNKEWVEKESAWIEVESENDPFCWPKTSDWKMPAVLNEILAAIAAKVAALCAGPLPPPDC